MTERRNISAKRDIITNIDGLMDIKIIYQNQNQSTMKMRVVTTTATVRISVYVIHLDIHVNAPLDCDCVRIAQPSVKIYQR